MFTLTPRAACAALALAVLPLAATAAHAEEIRLKVGDLSRPEQAEAFDRRIEAAADSFCTPDPHDLRAHARADCRQAIRDEVMSKLNPTQRIQYAGYTGHDDQTAHAGQ